MKYPTMRFVFDRKHVATKNKKGLVQIEVLSERKKKYISTSIRLYSDQWNEKKKVVNSVHSIQLNAMLDGMMGKLNDFILDLFRNGQQFDFEKLNAFLDKSNHSDSFIGSLKEKPNGDNKKTSPTKSMFCRTFLLPLATSTATKRSLTDKN